MNTRAILLVLLAAVMLSGCATKAHTDRSVRVGSMGCKLLPYIGSICKEGFQRLVENRKDDMYQTVGTQAIEADVGQMLAWSFKEDTGYLVINSRTSQYVEDLGDVYLIDMTYFYITDGEIKGIHNVSLVAVPNPDAALEDQPAYIYLWR